MLKTGMIIETYFGRGSDELVNRAFKNFVSQKLPFKRFNMNATYYYLSLTAFLLLKALSMMSAVASFRYQLTPPQYAGNYSTMPG